MATTQHSARQLNLGLAVAPAVEEAAFGLCQDAIRSAGSGDPHATYRLVLHLLYEALAAELAGKSTTWTHRAPTFERLRQELQGSAKCQAAQIVALACDAGTPPADLWAQLGALYAPLLDRQPWLDAATGRLRLGTAVGGERKDSGSYYTPDSLVECLLDSALEPLLAEASAAADPVAAILALRICDPSCGSGQFLLGAARRMARHLARHRPHAASMRDIVANSLFGVDSDATAVEICRAALWFEAGDPALPFDAPAAHIVHGNSLIGATRDLVATGIPAAAYAPLAGDDPAVCKALKRRNLPAPTPLPFNQEAADAWCAAFVWPKTTGGPPAPTNDDLYAPSDSSDPSDAAATLPGPGTRDQIRRLAAEYGFFHWELAFPEILATGGFDVLLGNPPWERFKLQDKEWFALRHPAVAFARNAADRQARIAALAHEAPDLLDAFRAACRKAEAESHFVRNSGRHPLCGRGDVNAYAVFAETFRSLLAPHGRAGFIVPAGIATDHTTREFFGDLVRQGSLVSFLDFENRRGIFPAVDSRVQFALVTLTGSAKPAPRADFLFFAHAVADLADPGRHIELSAADFGLLNPNTATCPLFRTRREADIVRGICGRVPVLVREDPPANPWDASFCRMFDMANDSGRFETAPRPDALPLYEAKLLHQFDHRWATFGGGDIRLVSPEEKADPAHRMTPRYWVSRAAVAARLGGEPPWLLAFRDIARSTDERTAMATVLPLAAVSHHAPLLRTSAPATLQACLAANLNAFVLDFVARTKVGGTHLTFFIVRQLPILPPTAYAAAAPWTCGAPLHRWIADRVVELVYTSPDLAPFARACGYDGPPFRWDARRRFEIRCELDAAYFRLYGVSRAAAESVLDSFPIVRRKDMAAWGVYRTKRTILDLLD